MRCEHGLDAIRRVRHNRDAMELSRSLAAILAPVCILAGLGCATPPPPSGEATSAPAGATTAHAAASAAAPLPATSFGAAITEKTLTPLSTLAQDPAKFTGKTIKTEGVVTAVCKAMGCWMDLGSDAGRAHIRMAGHAFFVPKTASGHHAIVQGTVAPAAESECKDGCGPEQMAKTEIEATGVQFVD
jgi:hypothetical protein